MTGIGIIKQLSTVFPRKSLITIYKSFVRSDLDYSNLIYDQPNNESFCQQIDSFNIMLPLQSFVLLNEHLDLNCKIK